VRRLAVFLLTGLTALAAEKVEILRDEYGVPHVFAQTAAGTAFGAGYAEAEDRTDALLRNLSGAVTGTPPELSQLLHDLLDAYCAGINRYLEEHPRPDSPKVTPAMVESFARRAFSTIDGSADVMIGPQRTIDGKVIAILDPLGSWNGDGRPYEMRLYASEGDWSVSGVAPPGVPFPLVGHTNSLAIGWTGAKAMAGPRVLEEAWAILTAHDLGGVKKALAMAQIPGSALIGTADGDIFDSAGGSAGNGGDDGYLLRRRAVPQADAMVRQILDDPSKWHLPRAVDLAFSTEVYQADAWQERLAKVSPGQKFTRMLTGWNRRSDASSTPALGFYLFKMALGPPDASALRPSDRLSDDRIRAALRKAQDRLEVDFLYGDSYGALFRGVRTGSLKSYPVGGGLVTQAGMATPRPMTFDQRGDLMLGPSQTGGAQAATQVVELSQPPRAMTVLAPGESDQRDSPHFEDQLKELFSKAQAQPDYFDDRKELEKHLSSMKELIF
jgi:acyl-homoserine lactone acylase PvdQ